MNHSVQKLFDDFIRKIGDDELKMLETVSPDAAFNYVFFLYKKIYGDYPSGDMFEALEEKFLRKKAA